MLNRIILVSEGHFVYIIYITYKCFVVVDTLEKFIQGSIEKCNLPQGHRNLYEMNHCT